MSYWAKIFSIPVLLFPRGGGVLQNFHRSFVVRCIARYAFSSPTKILCQGGQWVSFFKNEFGFIKKELEIIPNWTATDELLEVGRLRVFNKKPIKNILFVGWLVKEKGIYDLLEALNKLKDNYKFSVTFIGDGSEKKLLENRISYYNLQKSVTLVGWQMHSMLKNYYAKADIFVLPSWVEGLPNSMIEAMACGLPVVVTDVGNVRSVLLDNFNGKLVKPNNVDELINGFVDLFESFETRKYLGNNAHRDMLLNYSSTHSIQKLISILQKMDISDCQNNELSSNI